MRTLFTALVSSLAFVGCVRDVRDPSGRVFHALGSPSLTLENSHPVMISDVEDAMLDGSNIVLLQSADARVTAVTAKTGEVAWSFGRRGAGPAEFAAPSSLFARSGGGVGVVDPRQGRITLLRSSGALENTVTGDLLEREPHNICDAGRAGLLAIRLPRLDVVRATLQGRVVVQDSLVWPDSRMNSNFLFRQGYFARSHDGRCVAIAIRGDFFAEFDAEIARPRRFFRYRDAFVYADAVPQKSGPPVVKDSRTAASYAAVSGDQLFVLTGGTDLTKGRTVDVYSLSDGAYAYSIALPRTAYEIDVDAGRLLVLEWPDSGSRIDLYQLPKADQVRPVALRGSRR